ncbi:MAG TPA: hypothetical protein VIK94_02675 [Bacilli bacterium]
MILLIAIIIILAFILFGVSNILFYIIIFPLLFILYIYSVMIPKKENLTDDANEELQHKGNY